ncbi:hypothetical protein [Actinomadura sp. 9N407]|uniref:hypothetical protein n=1 Tax=Actinomadura sp. 9N407 TaxID=3375154 RepID=UPI0037940C0C
MKVTRKTLAAGLGGATLLGLGLYLAVPAAANPSPSPSATTSAHPKAKEPGQKGYRGEKGPRHRGQDGPRHRGRWAAGVRGVHGEATVQRKDGFHLRTWQTGEVTGRSGANVTVRSADGISWTWVTVGGTRVHKEGEKSAVSALANGDRVIVIGERAGTTRTAQMIRIPKPR